jgi:hypothetical protein
VRKNNTNINRKGVIELLYRYSGPDDALTEATIDWDDYFAPCPSMSMSEFNCPFETLEWFHARPDLFGGKSRRMIQRHDIINVVMRDTKFRSVCFIVADLQKDVSWHYKGCRIQTGGDNSSCDLVLIPLQREMEPFHRPKKNK